MKEISRRVDNDLLHRWMFLDACAPPPASRVDALPGRPPLHAASHVGALPGAPRRRAGRVSSIASS